MDQAWVAAAALIFLVLAYAILKPKKKDLLPSPPSLPLIGHFHLLSNLPHRGLGRLSIQYGPIFSLRLGFVNCVVVSSPQMAREFLKTHDIVFASRPMLEVGSILFYNFMDILFSQYGGHWKHMRKLCSQHLFTTKKLQETMHIRREEISYTMQSIKKDSLANRVVDLNSKLYSLGNNVITRMTIGRKFFGEGSAEAADKFKEMVHEISVMVGAFDIGDYLPFLSRFDLQGHKRKMEEVHLKLDTLLQKVLDEELEEIRKGRIDESGNLARVLLQEKLGHEAIKAVIQDMILGGTDTSSLTVEWAVAELLLNPEVMQKAQKELDEVVGSERPVEEEDIRNLPFLQAIVKETFRLHPASPLLGPHESNQDCKVAGYDIPKGTRLMVNAWQIGRDPDLWENPEVFNPNRFCNREIDVKGLDFELIPFGSGKRICPGIPLALTMVHIILASLLRSFNWKAAGEIDMTERFGATVSMANPLLAFAMPRSKLSLSS